MLPAAAKEGIPNVIAMFGNAGTISTEDGIAACAEGLAKIAPLAEKVGVTVILEMLNSRVDHRGFQGEHLGVRDRRRREGQLAARAAAVRHLPHADQRGRHHPLDPHQREVLRALPHGGEPGAERDR